jgi:hypothetical protein
MTKFMQVGDAWMAEVPCQYRGQCELEVSDARTSAPVGRFCGESNGIAAVFSLPRALRGRTVRLSLRAGAKVLNGICRVPETAPRARVRRPEVFVLVPVAKVHAAMPGLLLGDLEAKVAQGGLSVARGSALFALVAEQEPGASACRLTATSEPAGFFRFACEVEA